jgi:hypothetical protein
MPFWLEFAAYAASIPGKEKVIFNCAPFWLHTRSKDNETARRRKRSKLKIFVLQAAQKGLEARRERS